MSSKQKGNYQMKPLMYIVQPESDEIKVKMQSFVVRKAKKQQAPETATNEIEMKDEIEEAPANVQEAIQEEEREEAIEEQTAKQYRKQRKPIMQMSIEEKVEFFKNLPKNMPRTLCLIETKDEKYRGVIMTEENNIVTIRSLTHAKPIEIPLENIQVINLLGF